MNDNKIAIIGPGYVGLPLALAFSEKYEVIGFDINISRIDELYRGSLFMAAMCASRYDQNSRPSMYG